MKRILAISAWIGFIVMSFWRFYYISPFVRSWDEVDFALALDRFDLLAMQPHFPGYPYFVLGGMFVHRFVDDPVRALGVWNTGMAVLSTLPVYWIGRRCGWSRLVSLLSTLAVWTPAYLWVLAAQPMSEATAVGLLWWYVWSLQRGLDSPSPIRRWTLPLLLFSLLMGVRLSYAPFGLGLLLLAWHDRKEQPQSYPRRWVKLVLAGIAFQLIWVAALAWSEGGVSGLWALSKGFLFGHFNEWGGSAATSTVPLGSRTSILLFRNLLWSGLLGESPVTAAAYALLLSSIVLAWLRTKSGASPTDHGRLFVRWLMFMLLVYFLWALLGQNIEKPRHIAPLIGGLVLLLCHWTIRSQSRMATAALALTVVCQAVNGGALIKLQAEEKPAVAQLAEYISKQYAYDTSFTLYTWEESRVLAYMKVPFPHRSLLTYGLFAEQQRINPREKALLTDHVVQGFADQGEARPERLKPVAEFRSRAMFEPVYHHITVFEWIPKP